MTPPTLVFNILEKTHASIVGSFPVSGFVSLSTGRLTVYFPAYLLSAFHPIPRSFGECLPAILKPLVFISCNPRHTRVFVINYARLATCNPDGPYQLLLYPNFCFNPTIFRNASAMPSERPPPSLIHPISKIKNKKAERIQKWKNKQSACGMEGRKKQRTI